MTRVSVIMPVFNGERYLAEALESILAQSFSDFEVVAIDDGSNDATPQILDAFAARDPRVRVLHRPRSGMVPSRMAAVEAARGDLLAVMDADDVSRPERLARQVAFLDAHPEVLVLGADAMLIDPDGRPIGAAACAPSTGRSMPS